MRLLTAATAFATALAAQAQHWAFAPPQKRLPPAVAGELAEEIDRFVAAQLRQQGLRPAPAAEPLVLLRRVHLVLTGLPPTVDDVAAFLADPSPDAYERRVDALLATDACAEHLASTWLDLARFADTYGYQSDFECRTWPWRDWLIAAFRRDLPYDRFATELIAGDLLPDADQDTRTATAFFRLHRQTNEGGSIEAEWRHEYIADRVDTYGSVFLGLTVGCARCHDHKSDPITQRDYYALGGMFAIDESGLYPYTTGVTPRPAMRLATPAQAAELEALRQAVAAAAAGGPEVAAPGKVVARRAEETAFDGDQGVVIADVPAFTRDDAFRLEFRLWCPDHKPRAVVLHTSHYTEDADTQGYQLLIEDGRLLWMLVHHWPGSAIAIRTTAAVPLGRWLRVAASYDGSSRAAGLALTLDGEAAPAGIVRDHLDGPTTARALQLGARDRDCGLRGGRIADFAVVDCRTESPLVAARRALHAAAERLPELMVLAEHRHPEPRVVLRRGAYDQPDEQQPVQPGAIGSLLPWPADLPHTRLGLARWTAAQPLFARVQVDRLWALCFGQGLVRTPENFGQLGEAPLHQDLLDALAVDFAAGGYRQRALLRRIVTSATFRRASAASPAARERDPDNRWLARGPQFRLAAEALRDQALAGAGLLHGQVGGPSSKPWQPPGLWHDAGAGWSGADYAPDQGKAAHRRSLYTFRKRTAPPPNLTALDAPSRESCTVRRQVTDTPLQALVLLNDPVFHECARVLAERVQRELPQAAPAARLERAFLHLCARPPRPAELQALRDLYLAHPGPEVAALNVVCSTLLASDAVVVLR